MENEILTEAQENKIINSIANKANRSEKTSWNRKMDNMVNLLSKLSPIEDKIIAAMNDKIPLEDEIQVLRGTMVNECVHPKEYLTIHNNFVECKFCNKRVQQVNASE